MPMTRSAAARAVRRLSEAQLPIPQGTFRMVAYADGGAGEPQVALIHGDLTSGPILVRLHSECLTGDAFGSLRCDCGEQLRRSLWEIARNGSGVLLYLRQEGRGIGLAAKLQAYALQEQGLDTYDANVHLGYPPDARDYSVAASILRDLGIRSLRLLTNNPDKAAALRAHGLDVIEEVPLEVMAGVHNRRYLQTKRLRFGHRLRTDLDAGAC